MLFFFVSSFKGVHNETDFMLPIKMWKWVAWNEELIKFLHRVGCNM
jgi:hypothetical protein